MKKILCDYERYQKKNILSIFVIFMCDSGFRSLVGYRVRHSLLEKSRLFMPLVKIIEAFFSFTSSCQISASARIGEGCLFPHGVGIVIGAGAIIGKNATIYQNVTIGQVNGSYPVVGENVTVFPSAILVGEIHVGSNCKVGPGSLVISDVQDGDIVVTASSIVLEKK